VADNKQFALSIAAFAAKAPEMAREVARKASIDLLTNIVLRTPVGNPDVWKVNRESIYARSMTNSFVDRINSDTLSNPNNRTATGKLKKGVRATLLKRATKKELREANPIKAPEGYVGGRLRANWAVTINYATTRTEDSPDPSGNATISAGADVIGSWDAEGSLFMTNNLPYAIPVEYGHSGVQAPSGMVRISATEFTAYINKAVAELPK
jgi:hypothetical protein